MLCLGCSRTLTHRCSMPLLFLHLPPTSLNNHPSSLAAQKRPNRHNPPSCTDRRLATPGTWNHRLSNRTQQTLFIDSILLDPRPSLPHRVLPSFPPTLPSHPRHPNQRFPLSQWSQSYSRAVSRYIILHSCKCGYGHVCCSLVAHKQCFIVIL